MRLSGALALAIAAAACGTSEPGKQPPAETRVQGPAGERAIHLRFLPIDWRSPPIGAAAAPSASCVTPPRVAEDQLAGMIGAARSLDLEIRLDLSKTPSTRIGDKHVVFSWHTSRVPRASLDAAEAELKKMMGSPP